jgi:stage V sporulation protein SpoVS
MILKVKSDTPVKKLAGSIILSLQDNTSVDMHCVGPHTVNQAVKATIIARSMAVVHGYDLCITPSFDEINLEGREEDHRTMVKLTVKKVY